MRSENLYSISVYFSLGCVYAELPILKHEDMFVRFTCRSNGLSLYKGVVFSQDKLQCGPDFVLILCSVQSYAKWIHCAALIEQFHTLIIKLKCFLFYLWVTSFIAFIPLSLSPPLSASLSLAFIMLLLNALYQSEGAAL